MRRTKLCLLDNVACFSAGLALPHFQPAAQVAQHLFGAKSVAKDPDSTISPFAMAYLYGQAANALDFDDMLLGHPGSPIIGAVLAVAAHHRLSAARVLRGIAAGYEAHWILCAAASPTRDRAMLVRSIAVWDTVAATIACSVALDHDDGLMERAIGVAVAHSMLPYVAKWYDRPVPTLKNNMGWAAAGAVFSIGLATAGVRGVTAPLDGETGMWRMAGSDQWSLEEKLLERAAVLRVGFKQYPACWHIQEYLKTLSNLLIARHRDDAISEVIVAGPQEVRKFCPTGISGPADIAFSLPATMSLLISDVEPGPRWNLVDVDAGEHLFRYERSEQPSVLVHTRSGLELTASVALTDSSDLAASGLDDGSVVAKYERLTEPLLRAATSACFGLRGTQPEESVPDRFYSAVRQLIAVHIQSK